MEDIGAALFLMAVFGWVAFLIWNKSQKKQAERQMLFEAQKQILDKLGSGPELTQVLASEEGKAFFDRLKEEPRQSGKTNELTYLGWVMGMLMGGLVTLGVGLGMFYAAQRIDPEYIVPGGILVGAGGGLLIASAVTYRLSKKWGLLKKETGGSDTRAS